MFSLRSFGLNRIIYFTLSRMINIFNPVVF